MKRVRNLLIALVGLLGFAGFVAVMLMVIYPGAFKLTAPVVCPDDLPDAVVVRYNVETSDGQGTNFTLFCMGERGVFTEVGTWRPLAVLTLYFAGALLVVMIGLVVVGLFRRALGARAGPPPSGAVSTSDTEPPSPEESSPLIS